MKLNKMSCMLYGCFFMYLLSQGASSGIGAATAILMSKLGASVALTGRKEENLKRVGEQCNSKV